MSARLSLSRYLCLRQISLACYFWLRNIIWQIIHIMLDLGGQICKSSICYLIDIHPLFIIRMLLLSVLLCSTCVYTVVIMHRSSLLCCDDIICMLLFSVLLCSIYSSHSLLCCDDSSVDANVCDLPVNFDWVAHFCGHRLGLFYSCVVFIELQSIFW